MGDGAIIVRELSEIQGYMLAIPRHWLDLIRSNDRQGRAFVKISSKG